MYIIYNQTSYGDGIYFVGTTRSKKTAQEYVDKLEAQKETKGALAEDSYDYTKIENIDKYEVDGLIKWLKDREQI
jgi:hypothetical protein